jgi:hypothetical protein
MKKQQSSFGRLTAVTAVSAAIAVALSLAYLAAEPGRMHSAEILAVIFGVGLTVLVAGGLTALMYLSAASGHDDEVGRGAGGSDRD